MKRSLLIQIVVVALGLFAASTVSAQIHGGYITGQVTMVAPDVSGLKVGDRVSGTYAYDSTLILDEDAHGLVNELTAFSMTIGSHSFTLSDLDIDRERIPGSSTPDADALEFFFDPAVMSPVLGQPVLSQQILVIPPQRFTLSGAEGDLLQFDFIATPVPEPAAGGFLACLLLSGIVFTQRRRTSACKFTE